MLPGRVARSPAFFGQAVVIRKREGGRCQGLLATRRAWPLTGEARLDATLSFSLAGLWVPRFWSLFGNVRSMLPPLAPRGADGAGKVQRPFEHFVCPTGGLIPYLFLPLPWAEPTASLPLGVEVGQIRDVQLIAFALPGGEE